MKKILQFFSKRTVVHSAADINGADVTTVVWP